MLVADEHVDKESARRMDNGFERMILMWRSYLREFSGSSER